MHFNLVLELQARDDVTRVGALRGAKVTVHGLLSGIVILCITKWKSSHILQFSEELFFIYLLPPIIFNAGFQVKKKQFFHNFLTIMMFGVIGVFISSSIITAGSWWLFPTLGFVGLTVRDYLGEFFFHFI
ncbi:hypothetical protein Pint_04005 [Pistacia integerrima]|uniref:Uncharacterized protein n=1 Tax=Pistacia integerrima TaxID=434235 RepID=A0ACC0Z331_9ROSI|nr:hypothetical protein Pint_04005 [Pistacia integerrima]